MSSFRKVASLWLRKALSEKYVKNLQKVQEEDLPFDHLFSGKRRQVIDPKKYGGLGLAQPGSAKDLEEFLLATETMSTSDKIDWEKGYIYDKKGKIKIKIGKAIGKSLRKSGRNPDPLFQAMTKVEQQRGNGLQQNPISRASRESNYRSVISAAVFADPEFPADKAWEEMDNFGFPSPESWKKIKKAAEDFLSLSLEDRTKLKDRHDEWFKENRNETSVTDDNKQYWDSRSLYVSHTEQRSEKDTKDADRWFQNWLDQTDETYKGEDGAPIRALFELSKDTKKEDLQNIRDEVTKLAKVEQQKEDYDLWKSAFGEELVIVLSRDPVDVLRMSDHPKAVQAIESCHSEGGSEFSCAIEEAEEGGMVAYVVKKEDLEGVDLEDGELFEDHTRDVKGIKPYSRLRLRRFEKGDDGDGLEVTIPEDTTYGSEFPEFVNTMMGWAREAQPEFFGGEGDYSKSPGDWRLTGGEYQDTDSSELFQTFFKKDEDDDQEPTEDQYDPYGDGYTVENSPYYDPDAEEEEDNSEAPVSVKKVKPGKVPPQEFWEWMDKHHSQVPNPNSRGREDKITPSTLKGYARGRTNYSGLAQVAITRYMGQYEKLREKADSSKKVATTWLRQKIAAKYSPEFYQEKGIKRYTNPDTGNSVLFYNLPQWLKDRMYAQWEQRQKTPLNPKQREQLKHDMRQDEREQEEAEAAAGQADRKELAKKLKELKNKKLPARILKKEKMRLVQEIESRALAREQARKEKAKKVASLWLRSQIVKYERGI